MQDDQKAESQMVYKSEALATRLFSVMLLNIIILFTSFKPMYDA